MKIKKILDYLCYNNNDLFFITNCFKSGEQYLFCNTYSILKLNSDNNFDTKEDSFKLNDRLKEFKTFPIHELNPIKKAWNNFAPIKTKKGNYGYDIKAFNKINKIIKANRYYVLDNQFCPIIKLKNTKTKEEGYLFAATVRKTCIWD